MISVSEAIAIVRAQTPTLGLESVPLPEARGRVLAEEIVADTDLPPFNRAQMDGYAVSSADLTTVPARLDLVGESAAGAGWHHELKPGQAVRIMTGAPVPRGADSVQQVEVTRESGEARVVEIDRATKPGQFIVQRGVEVTAGSVVLRAGETVNAAMMASLASFGYDQVKVARRPRVSVMATGSELVSVDQTPLPDQIRDSNNYSIGAYAELAGAQVRRLPLAGDDPNSLQDAIAAAATETDVLVLSGGVSMGVYDFTKPALRALGAEIFFERVALRPGKPTVFARFGDALVFGLPGNPVSVSVTFNLFVRTALLAIQGATDTELSSDTALLARPVKGSGERESFLPATLGTNDEGQMIATPLKWAGSSDFVAFAQATALINVPANHAGYSADDQVRVFHLPS
jgi:molybdenum cofactor synthesis domain-containing protein